MSNDESQVAHGFTGNPLSCEAKSAITPFTHHSSRFLLDFFLDCSTSLSDRFTISLTTLSGDPDVYVLQNPAAGIYPSTTNYQYAALGSQGVELIVIKPSPFMAPQNCVVGQPCSIAISVYGSVGGSYE